MIPRSMAGSLSFALAVTLAACGGSSGTSHGSSTTPGEHHCSQPLHWNGHACVRTLNNSQNLGRICPPGQHREDGGCIDNGQSNDD